MAYKKGDVCPKCGEGTLLDAGGAALDWNGRRVSQSQILICVSCKRRPDKDFDE